MHSLDDNEQFHRFGRYRVRAKQAALGRCEDVGRAAYLATAAFSPSPWGPAIAAGPQARSQVAIRWSSWSQIM